MSDDTSKRLQRRLDGYIQHRARERGRPLSYEEYQVEGFAWLLCQPEWEFFIL